MQQYGDTPHASSSCALFVPKQNTPRQEALQYSGTVSTISDKMTRRLDNSDYESLLHEDEDSNQAQQRRKR